MNAFDSTSIEALALHYAGFGLFAVVNNVWTILALFSAALSFWRLRVTSSNRLSFSDSVPDDASAETPSLPCPSPTVAAAPQACDGDVVVATKGRFVAYYCYNICSTDDATATTMEEDDEEEEVVEGRVDRRYSGGGGGEGGWWECWEKAMRVRSNGVEVGTGWYDYQDRAVLSGSVVRLWDAERRRTTTTATAAAMGLAVPPQVTSSWRCCTGF